MKSSVFIFQFFLLVVLFVSCDRNKTSSIGDISEQVHPHYVSIDGLWISTQETSRKFGQGVHEPVLRISRDLSGELKATGIHLWNGDYNIPWIITDIQFNDSTHQLMFIDDDGDIYQGTVNENYTKIIGSVHLLDGINKDSLNLERADINLGERLFYPRIPDLNGNITYAYQQPEQHGDGLKTASLFDSGVDTATFFHLIDRIIIQEFGRIESLLILKDGKLLLEEYFFGYDKDQLHKIHSCTKSVVSLLLGISLANHPEIDVNQSIFSLFPEFDSLKTAEKEKITMKNVLMMTSGIDWSKEPEKNEEIQDVFYQYLSLPMAAAHGIKFQYSDGNTDILGRIIENLEGKNILQIAESKLFEPLGISNYGWDNHPNGFPKCGSGLGLRSRDMGKIGLLILNDGKWENQQIVPSEWIEESTKPQVMESEYFHYGYQFWHHSEKDKKWWDSRLNPSMDEHEVVMALGWGGQYIMVIRDLDLIIVLTASNYYSHEEAFSQIEMVIEEIMPLFGS